MQLVYGLVWFEDTDPQKIKKILNHTTIDGIKFHYYKSISRDGQEQEVPGVLVTGVVGDHWTSQKIVERLRYHLNLSKEAKNCDLSIENEDRVIPIKQGQPGKTHATIRIEPPQDFPRLVNLLRDIQKQVEPETMTVRTAEETGNGAVACIEVSFSPRDEEKIEQVKQQLESEGYKTTQVTIVKLEH